MKEEYTELEAEVIIFEAVDVIRTSDTQTPVRNFGTYSPNIF